jgi:hypothetical protein
VKAFVGDNIESETENSRFAAAAKSTILEIKRCNGRCTDIGEKETVYRQIPGKRDDDDDVYLDKLQTRGVKKSTLYM